MKYLLSFASALLLASAVHAGWYNAGTTTTFGVGEILFEPEANGPYGQGTIRFTALGANMDFIYQFPRADLDIAKSHLAILMTASATGKNVQVYVPNGCPTAGAPCAFSTIILQP